MTRRWVVIPLVLAALVALTFVGCNGWGRPTVAGTHRFQLFSNGEALEVSDPPPVAAFLFTGSVLDAAGQFAPDGQWLYVAYSAGGSDTLASVSAQPLPGLLRVDIRVQSHCFLSCAADASFQATRVRLDPPTDPASYNDTWATLVSHASFYNTAFCGGTGTSYQPNKVKIYGDGHDSGSVTTWDWGCDTNLLGWASTLN